ncbi:tripartite tricarboxylate transporter substrate-binding protein [Palleronia sp.]|uniref:tripartite tricarboxylate transporter substrate-binding protein n=1 Tax=Palleronia sp. TaxID=1940284 RepID=UPI0035C795F2
MKNVRILAAGLLAGAALLPGMAAADYPEGPVEFIVPFPPGDLEDVLTRMIAEDFQAEYGVPAAVVNKPGGGGGPFPGAVEASMAGTDGYTVGSFVSDVPVIGPEIGIPPLNPFPFEPLGRFLTYPFVIATAGDAPFATMEELASYAADHDVVLGHFGSELAPTRVTFALAEEMGFSYGSDAAFDALDCNSLASGDVDVINTTLQQVRPCLDDLTILASIGEKRTGMTPDTPTVAEIVPELAISLWNGLYVHKDTPQEARDAIVAVAKKTVQSDRAQQLADDTGALVYWEDAEATANQIEADKETTARINALLGE